MNITTEKKNVYLLVTFEENDNMDELQQEVLQLAYNNDVIPYTSKHDNSYILDVSAEIVHPFRCMLSKLPVTVKMLLEK